VTAPRSIAAERAWMQDELRWLRHTYGVRRLDVGVVRGRGRETEWTSVTPTGTTIGTHSSGSEAAWTLGELAPAARRIDPVAFPASRSRADIGALTELWAKALASPASAAMREVATRGDSVSGDFFGATVRGGLGFRVATKKGAERVSLVDLRDGRTLVLLGYPATGAGGVIVTDSDRVGVGLAIQVAQRLAMVERWPEYPAQD
jgi:hypothetical protein